MPASEGLIRFEGVWKRFRRGEIHDSLRDLLPALSRRLVTRNAEALRSSEFWALRDVSFEVRPGQALGIIGGNGAGKSTALRILTRILRPTRGLAELRGRVGAMIEVSAGFHQDLTGRENIFLQGSIMGMPTALIRSKFDEIVEFSGIEEFLDTPVKRYSSGMSARLGFSIAAHLDPDVLVIDEVLAVGDFRFQDRAFGRIRTMVASGIPVVIVSHQLDRIAALCTEALVLERGRVAHRGSPADCVAWYHAGGRAAADGTSRDGLQLGSLTLDGPTSVTSGDRVQLVLQGSHHGSEHGSEAIKFLIRAAATGAIEFGTTTARCGLVLPTTRPFRLRTELSMNLRPGVYMVETWVADLETGRDLVAGPTTYVEVANDPGFIGATHLHPRMSLEAADHGG